MVMVRLQGKVTLITGAGSGMGLEAARLFASEGAKVVATDIAIAQLESEISKLEGDFLTLELNVVSEEAWSSVVQKTIEKYGKIDILINNAGICVSKGILDENIKGWDLHMDVDLKSVWLGMKAVIPEMQKNGKGSIVNCSSLAAMFGTPADSGAAAYSAAKGGVRSLTKHAAQNFAKDNIRVNSVHPGAVFTGLARAGGATSVEQMGQALQPLIPLPPHCGEALDIAYAYLYLASDESKFVTGAELVIDGGWGSH